MAESADHYVDCLYTFNAPDELIESFKQAVTATKDGARCQLIEYKDDHFHLTCLRTDSDRILKTFLAIYSGYIETERLAGPADAFEVPKINRRKDTTIYEDSANIYEVGDEDIEGSAGAAQITDTVSEEIILIDHESITRVYKTSEAFDMQLLRKLEGLTKCTIEVKDETKEIFVKGDAAQDVERMCRKLAVVDQAYSRYKTQKAIFDYYNVENEANFRFHFYRAERLIDRRIQADHPNFHFEYLELTLVKYIDSVWQPHIIRRTLIEPGEASVHPWRDFVYPALGSEAITDIETEENSSKVHDYLAPEKVRTLTSWTKKVPILPEDAFEAVSADHATNPELLPPITKSQKDYVKSRRVVKGQPEAVLQATPIDSQTIPKPPAIKPPYMPITVEEPADDTANLIDMAESPELMVPKVSIYHKQGSLIDHPEPVVYIAAKSPEMQQISHWKNAQEIINQNDRDISGDSDNVVDARVSTSERLQQTSESQSRKYRRTANLKASKTAVSNFECPSLVGCITQAMSTRLESARTGYGRVKLDVAIGCIYVKRTNLAREIQTGSFGQADWPTAFETRSGDGRTPTLFSSTLTTSWVDVNFIVDLKLKNSTRMFSDRSTEAHVTYLIKCANKHRKHEVTIEIDQDGKHRFYDALNMIGSVNCYYPRRVWDTVFRITESSIADISPQDPVKSVVDNFWVRGGTSISLGSQLPGPELNVTSVQVRRQICHQSIANPDLSLHLTEVQDLIVQQYTPRQFRAYAAPEDQMIEDDNRVWWEASITSKVANNILLENQQLELGEIAQWSPDDIIGMCIIDDMFRLAEQVVTRIDSVGYGTKDVFVSQQPSGTARSATKSTMTGKKDRYEHTWAEW